MGIRDCVGGMIGGEAARNNHWQNKNCGFLSLLDRTLCFLIVIFIFYKFYTYESTHELMSTHESTHETTHESTHELMSRLMSSFELRSTHELKPILLK